jgi:hypothetical protein
MSRQDQRGQNFGDRADLEYRVAIELPVVRGAGRPIGEEAAAGTIADHCDDAGALPVLADAFLQYRLDRLVGRRVGIGPEPAERGRERSEKNFATMQHGAPPYTELARSRAFVTIRVVMVAARAEHLVLLTRDEAIIGYGAAGADVLGLGD